MNERVAQRLSRILVLVLVGLAVGCSSERQGSAPTDDVETGGDAAVLADGSQSDAQADAEADTAAPVVCKQVTTWQPGTPVFVEATAEWGLTGVEGTRLSVVDYDSDGLPDVLIRRNAGPDDFAKDGKRNRWLLRSTGTGFVDVTAASKLLKARKSGTNGALKGVVFAAGDVDNDGDDDIFLARASDKPGDATDGETSELLLNNGDGTYSIGPDSAARMAKLATSPASVTFVDVDRDGNLDLWMTHNAPAGGQSPMQDRLFKGDGKGGFVDITVASGLTTKPWKLLTDLNEAKAHSRAWSSAACDLNNDGWPELLASSYGRAPNHLWQAKSSA
ncbi:MAG: VCBS repeat-containing protein, partial [Myxococcales bacterium]|nr:VCBS repeat-containing protein [Myxococcales bacterium]